MSIPEMYIGGMSVREIARELHHSQGHVLSILHSASVTMRNRGQRPGCKNTPKRQLIVALRRQGHKYCVIKRKAQCCHSYIIRVLNDAGLIGNVTSP
jgi:hypothetical protein